ncbi:MAG: hypothetical protein JWQ25_538 [Daejeonella sp.]|nr:hypothetical protein [Daejeonella sp.]
MLKASALYLVIIVSLIIAIFSATLITTAYLYKLEYQKNLRYSRLSSNLQSGYALALSSSLKFQDQDVIIDLFGEEKDSILVREETWGIYKLAQVKSFTQRDSLNKTFLIGNEQTDSVAIYLADEDRPLSVSGSTQITGEGILPKAGLKPSYVEGKPYAAKHLINGKIRESTRTLPQLESALITRLEYLLQPSDTLNFTSLQDSLSNSFFNPTTYIRLSKNRAELDGNILKGKIVIVSDTTVHISAKTVLEDVQVYATAIIVEEGFIGNCQLFARDSVVIGKNSRLKYPSCIGVIKKETGKIQPKIELGEGTEFSGILFSYEKNRSDLQTSINLSRNTTVYGEVYVTGYVKLQKPLQVFGKVSCTRFIVQTPTTLYENYLIDVVINRKKLSADYLSSSLFTVKKPKQNILKWLN